MKTVEYRVRPVTRYVVTKWNEDEDGSCAVETAGEFDTEVRASNTAFALADHETHMAQPPERVIRHDKATWDRATGQWSDEPTAISD